MKKNHYLSVTIVIALALPLAGCFEKSKNSVAVGNSFKAPAGGPAATGSTAVDESLIETIVPGAGSTLAPTADAFIGRIERGLMVNGALTANRNAGNCQTAYGQVAANLNNNPNPFKANLGGPMSLLVYSCCSDVPMASFGVTAADNQFASAAAQSQVAAAGVKILDAYMGGLASTGPVASQVSQVFANLSSENSKVLVPATNPANAPVPTTTRRMFVHACVAAVTYGASMTGI